MLWLQKQMTLIHPHDDMAKCRFRLKVKIKQMVSYGFNLLYVLINDTVLTDIFKSLLDSFLQSQHNNAQRKTTQKPLTSITLFTTFYSCSTRLKFMSNLVSAGCGSNSNGNNTISHDNRQEPHGIYRASQS